MITCEEIKHIANKTGLSSYQVEKDYALTWILVAMYENKRNFDNWIFKGGTCLKKCYFGDYRFSEDLDFTLLDHKNDNILDLRNSITSLFTWIYKNSGIEIDKDRSKFESHENISGQNIIQGRIYYRGPMSPSDSKRWPKIKFDITSHEKVVLSPEKKRILHDFSDAEKLSHVEINCYPIYEIFAEKIRALFERTRPRDLYDVVQLYQKYSSWDVIKLKNILRKKCEFKGINKLHIQDLKIKFYYLPGSHIEQGESAQNAPVRELKEETGFECKVKRFLGCLEYSFDPEENSICHNHEYNLVFEATSSSLESAQTILSPESHIELVWMSLGELDTIDFRPEPLVYLIPQWLKNEESNMFQSEMI